MQFITDLKRKNKEYWVKVFQHFLIIHIILIIQSSMIYYTEWFAHPTSPHNIQFIQSDDEFWSCKKSIYFPVYIYIINNFTTKIYYSFWEKLKIIDRFMYVYCVDRIEACRGFIFMSLMGPLYIYDLIMMLICLYWIVE